VTVPDIPGCFSAGGTVDEALLNAIEAIECHLEGLLQDNELIPVPQAIESHRLKTEYKNGTWAIVDVDISKLTRKAKRVNITIPERLLETIDKYACDQGLSRSKFLAQAAADYMSKSK